jgi:hypothetical protein
MAKEMFDIVPWPRKEIVQTKDFGPLRKKALAKVGAKKAGTTRNRNPPLQMHLAVLLNTAIILRDQDL